MIEVIKTICSKGIRNDQRKFLRELSLPIFIIFTNPSDWTGYDTRSIFMRSLTGLNSEFSFS